MIMSRWIPRAWTGLPGTFWTLFVGVFFMAVATFVFPFLALFLRSRGYPAGEIGLLVALFGAGSIPSGPLAGWLADRIGRRPTLLGALISAAGITALLPLLSSPGALAVGTLLLGVAVHAYYPAANAVVADVVDPVRYSDAYGLLYWERNAGIAISFSLGGALAAYGYERLFFADAASTLLFASVVFFKIRETRPVRPADRDAEPPFFEGLLAVLSNKRFHNLLLVNIAFFTGLFQFMVALPVAMSRQGVSPADYGRTMAVNGLLIMLCQPWVGRLASTMDPARALAGAAFLVAFGYGAYAWCATPLQFSLATAVWTIGEIVTIPLVSALVAKLSPPEMRGRYQGAFGLSFGIALTLAPALGGQALGRWGAPRLWLGVATLCSAVGFAHLLEGRARRHADAPLVPFWPKERREGS
jgi:MFS family permease